MKIIQQAKDTHLPRKTVKFKKKKHKKIQMDDIRYIKFHKQKR